VLDIQSAQMAAFDESDIAALQGMADQVAVALENARLLQQAQAALKEIEETNRLLVREGWQGYLEQKTTRRAEFLAASGPFQDPLQHKQALQTEPLTIPIELRGQSLGRLTLRREGSRAWSEDETQLIQTIALQTVLAAENARLVEQTQMALRETEGLFKAAVAISGPTDLREICQNLAGHFHDLVQADRTVLTLVNQQRKQILLRVGHGNITEELQMTFEELSAGLGGQVMATGQPVLSVTNSDKAESEATRERRSRLNIGSLIVAPLITKGGVVGIAGAYRRTDQRPFTQHDVELLMALTAQAAMAVENVRLLEETQRRAEREQLIRQITTRIRAAGDVQGVLETTATELAQSMGASRAIVRLTMGDDA